MNWVAIIFQLLHWAINQLIVLSLVTRNGEVRVFRGEQLHKVKYTSMTSANKWIHAGCLRLAVSYSGFLDCVQNSVSPIRISAFCAVVWHIFINTCNAFTYDGASIYTHRNCMQLYDVWDVYNRIWASVVLWFCGGSNHTTTHTHTKT